jgi:hypothetical protein
MTPLRQFKGIPTEVVRKAEGKQFVSIISFCIFAFLTSHLTLSLGIDTLTW